MVVDRSLLQGVDSGYRSCSLCGYVNEVEDHRYSSATRKSEDSRSIIPELFERLIEYNIDLIEPVPEDIEEDGCLH